MRTQNHTIHKLASDRPIGGISGKLVPQAIDLEKVILGAMLIDEKGLEVIEMLSHDVFYKQAHKLIFKAIREVYLSSDCVDLLTISSHLKKNKNLEKVGGDFYLISLTQKVASSAHIEFHARIILQKYIQRQLIKSSSEIIEKAYEDTDVFELLDTAYNQLNDVGEVSMSNHESALGDVIESVVERGKKIYNNEIKPGIITPIHKLTKKTGGWRDGELTILAARPGMGKTSFALLCALDAAKNKIPTAFFSLEMNKANLTSRILSMEHQITLDKFNVHGLNQDDINKINSSKKLNQIPLYIEDTPSLSIEQFQIKAKRLKNKNKVGLILVDYLQLMTAGGSQKGVNREQEISKISRGLKKVSIELNIPIIALSQLSRAVESRNDKRPILSDLRESGAIEQDADVVMFLYRPEYYQIMEWDDTYNREPTQNEAEYLVAKNRNGGLVRNRMGFEGKYTLFSDLDEVFDITHEPIKPIYPTEAFDDNFF